MIGGIWELKIGGKIGGIDIIREFMSECWLLLWIHVNWLNIVHCLAWSIDYLADIDDVQFRLNSHSYVHDVILLFPFLSLL